MFSPNTLAQEFEQSFQAFIHEQLSSPTSLHLAMKYSLLNGGKRIRPLLALESSQLAGLPLSIAMRFAFAIEIAHGFSLVHDDLPSMDNDDFRRGLPTTHRKFGEATALLAGDALLNLAHKTFLSCINGITPESFARASQFFSDAIHGMILGQTEELNVDQSNIDELIRIQFLKTGKLFQASILCPLYLSGRKNGDSLFTECESYAEAFGFAFQIADDLEDETQDRIQNTKNILSHLGRNAAITLATEKLLSNPHTQKFSATKILLSKLK